MKKRWQIEGPAGGIKVARMAARGIIATIIALNLASSLSTSVQAEDENPVDLELGGEGATPWSISDIKPGDNGTQLVELHNVGSRPGYVTIWISEVISSEGLNPESETGNTAEPGELNNNLLLNISSNRSSTTLEMPTTINTLPQSISNPNSIEIVPLKVGDVVDLQWEWILPTSTSNDVQGDGISFTINYLLTELEIIDVSEVVEEETGTFTDNVTVESEISSSTIRINEGTVGKTIEDEPIEELWFVKLDKNPSTPSVNKATVGAQYEAGPHGTTFDQPTTITLSYNLADIPERAREEDLVIVTWDEGARDWIEIAGSTVNTLNRTVSAQTTHFSRYNIHVFVPPPPPPPPPPPTSVGGEEEPLPVVPPRKEDEVVSPPVLNTNILGDERKVEIEAYGTLRESLTLTDPDGHFVIEVGSGSKIVSSDGRPLTRMEVKEVEKFVAPPRKTVTLSSVYKVTGYIEEVEVPMINFDPSAELTILYDPRDLPENAFAPYIANYTEETGWAQLEAPPGSLFEIGKARALIHHASWFGVIAKLSLPPPPLPAEFRISDLTINPERSQLGNPVIINLNITNTGEVAGSYEMYLIIDGIVRAVKEITLAGQSIETVSFEVSNLAAGKHQVKIAGLTGEFQIVQAAAALPDETTIGWFFAELSLGIVIITLLSSLFLIIRRARRVQQSQYDSDTVADALRHKDGE